jgi:hypothetical protein
MSGTDGSNLVPGGGADLSKFKTQGTELQTSDQATANNYEYFQSSDLSKPSTEKESWRSLSDNMEPSQGSGSGQIDQKSPDKNDAQWLRAFSLIVYSHSVTSGGSVPIPRPASFDPNAPPPKPKFGNVIPFRRTPRGDPVDPVTGNPITPDDSGNADFGGGSDTQQPGIDISNLRCSFSIQKIVLNTPNMLYARIYNLAPATLAKVIAFTRVQVYAGYKHANYGMIFDGEVIQYRRGKENPVDTYLEIHAADGETALNGTVQFKTYPAGTKERQKLDDLNDKKKQLDPSFKVEHIDENLYQAQSQRDSVVVGHSRTIERRIMLASGAQHFLDNGKFIAITNEGYRKTEKVILSPSTGLIGLPEVTPQGIQAKCLLNPKLMLGGIVKIDSKLLSAVAYTPGSTSKVDASGNVVGGETGGKVFNTNMWRQQFEAAYTSPIGEYKILLMTYTGDTRGNPWYCDLICIAMDSDGKAILGNNTSNAWMRASQQAKEGTLAK